MRIPPDLLALRPDQKDVDASVINMADPFTEEILREQAETARRQSGANIIEESQAPQEEFVPSQGAKSVAPPRRPNVEPLNPSRIAATTLAAPTIPTARSTPSFSVPQRPIAGAPLPPAATVPALPPGARTPTGQIPHPGSHVRASAAKASSRFQPAIRSAFRSHSSRTSAYGPYPRTAAASPHDIAPHRKTPHRHTFFAQPADHRSRESERSGEGGILHHRTGNFETR